MYSILMKDGNVIDVNATSSELWDNGKLSLYNGIATIGELNMDSIIGWIDSDYMAESED